MVYGDLQIVNIVFSGPAGKLHKLLPGYTYYTFVTVEPEISTDWPIRRVSVTINRTLVPAENIL